MFKSAASRCLLFSEWYAAPTRADVSQPVPLSVWGHPADAGSECQQQGSVPGGIQLPDQRGPGDPAQPAPREQLPGSVPKKRYSTLTYSSAVFCRDHRLIHN